MTSKSRLWTLAVLAFALALAIGSVLARPADLPARISAAPSVLSPPANIFVQPGGPNARDSPVLETTTPMDHA
jgi:hypothetical protein